MSGLAGDVSEARLGLIRRIIRSIRYRMDARIRKTRAAVEAGTVSAKETSARSVHRAHVTLSERVEKIAIAAGAMLVRSGTQLLLYPHHSEDVELPQPLTSGGRTFDVVEDLEQYTGLSGVHVRSLLKRRMESFRTEWFSFPPTLREDTWYYRSSRLYLFANAVHIHDTPALLQTIASAAPPKGRILEFGGGTGNLTLALAAQGFRMDYVDLSALQKDFVRFRASKHGLRDHVSVLDSWQSLPGAAYDMVVALDVLEHLPDLRGVLEGELLPSLAPGGILVEQSPFLRTVSNPMHHLDDDGLDSILVAHGLELISEQPLCRIWQSRDARRP